VAGDEPGGFDVVFVEEFEKAPRAERASEESCGVKMGSIKVSDAVNNRCSQERTQR
jgi:hypothetical protein